MTNKNQCEKLLALKKHGKKETKSGVFLTY